jgi:hypothetical protein
MAWVYQKSLLTYTFMDTSGEKVQRTYEMRDQNFTYVNTVSSNMLTTLGALTDATITQREVSHVFVNDAAALPASANNKKVLLINDLLKGDPTVRGYLSLPAPKATLFNALTGQGSNIMTWPQTAVLNFLKNFVATEDTGYQNFYISDGERLSLDDVVGRKVSRKHS